MHPRSRGLLFGTLLVLVGLAVLGLLLRNGDHDAGSPAAPRAATSRAAEPRALLPPPVDEASGPEQRAEVQTGDFAGPVPDPAAEAPGPSSDADCELALHVVDSPGGLAVTSFDLSLSAWDCTDAQFALPPTMLRSFPEHWEHVDDPNGRTRVRGVSCERPIGLVCRAPDRPAKQFGPFLPEPGAAEVELVLGGPATLSITVVDEHDIPFLALAELDIARQVCADSTVFQEIPGAAGRGTHDLSANTARVEGLAAGHFAVMAASTKGTDLAEVDLIAGATTPLQLVLRPDRQPGSLSVLVIGSDGPRRGVRVELGAGLSRPDDFSMEASFAMTGPDGRCRFQGLPPDLYPVWLAPHEHRCVVVIRSGTELEHEISIGP